MKYSNRFIQIARILSLVLIIASIAGCKKNTAAAGGEGDDIVYAVNTYKIEKGNLDQYLEFGGDVASVSAVDVLPDMSGKISRVLSNIGDTVAKDQVIAYVDASRPGMSYSESPVRAPVSGRIITSMPSVGATVSQTMPVVQIGSTGDLEIRVNIPERFVSRIQRGQSATAQFAAYPGIDFTAKVVEVSPVLDTMTRTMAVKLHLSPPDERIKVGMYGSVRLITDSIQNAIVVPSGSVITRAGKPYIFAIASQAQNDKAAVVKMLAVTEGISVDNRTEITSGLSAGDEIVVKGQTLLNDGAKVNIVGAAN